MKLLPLLALLWLSASPSPAPTGMPPAALPPATVAVQTTAPAPATPAFYDLHDLVRAQRGGETEVVGDEAAGTRLEFLARVIRSSIEPRLLEPRVFEPRNSVTILPGSQLLVVGDRAQQEWTSRFLERQRQALPRLGQFQCRFYDLGVAQARELGMLSGEQVLNAAELAALLSRLEHAQGLDMVSAPQLLTFELGRASIQSFAPLVYVAGYDVHEQVEPGAQRLVVPRIETLNRGLQLELQWASVDAGHLHLELALEHLAVREPFVPVATEHGPILQPTTDRWQVETSLLLPDGGGARLGGVEVNGRVAFALVQATLVEPQTR
jgi:hypothetical protein